MTREKIYLRLLQGPSSPRQIFPFTWGSDFIIWFRLGKCEGHSEFPVWWAMQATNKPRGFLSGTSVRYPQDQWATSKVFCVSNYYYHSSCWLSWEPHHLTFNGVLLFGLSQHGRPMYVVVSSQHTDDIHCSLSQECCTPLPSELLNV